MKAPTPQTYISRVHFPEVDEFADTVMPDYMMAPDTGDSSYYMHDREAPQIGEYRCQCRELAFN